MSFNENAHTYKKKQKTIGIDERENTQYFFIELFSFFHTKKAQEWKQISFSMKIIFTSAATKNAVM